MKKVIILGGSSGIGFACAELLKKTYEEVVIVGKNKKRIEDAQKKLQVNSYVCDCTQEDKVLEMVSVLGNSDSNTDWVFCVGSGVIGEIQKISLTQWEDTLQVNTTSAFIFLKTVLPVLYRRKRGNIIFIGSEAGQEGFATYSAYCSAKFALRGLVESVYSEARLNGIKISLIHPGDVDTPFMKKCPIDLDLMKKYDIKVCNKEHMLKPETVATTVKYLLSLPRNAYVPSITILPEDFE